MDHVSGTQCDGCVKNVNTNRFLEATAGFVEELSFLSVTVIIGGSCVCEFICGHFICICVCVCVVKHSNTEGLIYEGLYIYLNMDI